MSILASGHQELSNSEYLAIIHGGDTFEDLHSPEALAAHQGLEVALSEVTLNYASPIPADIANQLSSNRAEEICLLVAQALEENPVFDAGLGSKLQNDGVIRVSAGFMESSRQQFSSIVNVEGILHPSTLAYVLQSRRFSMLDGQGASKLAEEFGISNTDLSTPATLQLWKDGNPKEREAPLGHGTIGCVAVDTDGNLAVVTSTGGVGNETPGRIGDTPTIAGTYCTDTIGISCAGFGEQIVNSAFAARVAVRVQDGLTLLRAMDKSITEAQERGYHMSSIAIMRNQYDSSLDWVVGSTATSFAWAVRGPDGISSFLDSQ